MSVYVRRCAIVGALVVALLGLYGLALPAAQGFADGNSALQVANAGDASAAATTDVDEPAPSGWVKEGTSWTYYKADGTQAKSCWIDTNAKPKGLGGASGTHRYWVDKSGKLAVSRFIDPSKSKDVGAYNAFATEYGYVKTGAMRVTRGAYNYIYFAKKSGNAIGKFETGNVRGSNGKLTSILRSNEYNKAGAMYYYYINPKTRCAVVAIDKAKRKAVSVNNYGAVLPWSPWTGCLWTGGRKTVDNRTYFAKTNGKLETGNVVINGKKTTVLRTSRYDNGTVCSYFIDPSTYCSVKRSKAALAKNFGYVLPSGKYGRLACGRKVIGNKVYLAKSIGRYSGMLEKGNSQGFLRSKSYNSAKKSLLYYIDPKTHAITYGKPVKVSNQFGYVYAPNKNGNLLTSLKRVDSKHIILAQKNGRVYNKRGWLVTADYTGALERYWIEPTAKNKKVLGARLGYFRVKGTLYKGLGKGYVQRNSWGRVNSTYYWVNNDGKFQRNNVVTKMYRRAQGYGSPSHYLLMVDIDNPKTIVFTGSQGNWHVKYIWDCCTGHPSTPTVVGTFSLGSKGYSFGEGNGYSCYYWSQIYGGYLFHSQLYYPYTRTILDGTINRRCSHGCVRLWIDNAKWLQDHVPSGTTVACIR